MRTMQRTRVTRTSWLVLMLAISATVGLPTSLVGQTKFLWPEATFDVTHVRYVEVCYAIQRRITDSIEARNDFRDTLHYAEGGLNRTRYPAVIAVTKRCMAKFPPDKIAPEDEMTALELYLIANDDAAAKTIVERRVERIANLSPEAQYAHMDTMVELYYHAEPIRLTAAMDLINRMVAVTKRLVKTKQLSLYARVMSMAEEAGDSHDNVIAWAFNSSVDVIKAMSDQEFVGIPGQQGWMFVKYNLIKVPVHRTRLLAKLTEGTRQYFDEPAVIFTDLVGRAPPDVPDMEAAFAHQAKTIGQPTTIHGDYWFPKKPDGIVYPRQGVVTIVSPVYEGQGPVGPTGGMHGKKGDREEASSLVMGGAVYRRFKERWPDLELVFLANTFGFLKITEPLTPEREAILLDSMYRHYYKLPGILVVSKTDFWRLPGYDRRRINEATENKKQHGVLPQTYVFDKEGLMVVNSSAMLAEQRLEEIIGVLMKRPYRGPARADAK